MCGDWVHDRAAACDVQRSKRSADQHPRWRGLRTNHALWRELRLHARLAGMSCSHARYGALPQNRASAWATNLQENNKRTHSRQGKDSRTSVGVLSCARQDAPLHHPLPCTVSGGTLVQTAGAQLNPLLQYTSAPAQPPRGGTLHAALERQQGRHEHPPQGPPSQPDRSRCQPSLRGAVTRRRAVRGPRLPAVPRDEQQRHE